jgi:hypothetical protein
LLGEAHILQGNALIQFLERVLPLVHYTQDCCDVGFWTFFIVSNSKERTQYFRNLACSLHHMKGALRGAGGGDLFG